MREIASRLKKLVLPAVLIMTVGTVGLVVNHPKPVHADSATSCSNLSTVNSLRIYNFICPQSPVTGGNSYDNPSYSNGSSNMDLSVDSSSPAPCSRYIPKTRLNNSDSTAIDVAPGACIPVKFTYTVGNSGSNVFAWLQTPASSNVIYGSVGDHGVGSNTPGDWLDTYYHFNNQLPSHNPGPGYNDLTSPWGGGCPAFWVGPQSPYGSGSVVYNSADGSVEPGPTYSNAERAGNFQIVSSATSGHTGCGSADLKGTAAIWGNAGGVANNTYTYTARYDVLPDAFAGHICISGRVATDASDNTGAYPLSDLKARSNSLCYQTVETNVHGTIKYADGTAIPSSLAEVTINNHCEGAGPRPLAQGIAQDGSGNWSVNVQKGQIYCLSAPAEFTNPNNGRHYVLTRPDPYGAYGTRDNQVAGVDCGAPDSTDATKIHCDFNNIGADFDSDSYAFVYARDTDVVIKGKVSDSVAGQGVDGIQVLKAGSSGTCSLSSEATDTTDGSGTYDFVLNKGDHFCVGVTPDYTSSGYPSNGFHYKNPSPTQYIEQVAGLDCRSFAVNSDQGAACTGWSTSQQDNTHIKPEALVSTDNDTACLGASAGTNASAFSGGGNDSTVIEDYENTQTHTGSYAVNAKCIHTERLIATSDGPCVGQTDASDVSYGANYDGNDFRRCWGYRNTTYYDTSTVTYSDGLCKGQTASDQYGVNGYPANERCKNQYIGDERKTLDGAPGKCKGGQDEGYWYANDYSKYMQSPYPPTSSLQGQYMGDANGGPIADRRCNQWQNRDGTYSHSEFELPYRNAVVTGDNLHHTVYGLVRQVYRKDFVTYPNDHPVDNDYNFTMDPYTKISGTVSDAQGGIANAHIEYCIGGTTTDSNGNFSFEVKRRAGFCVRDPQYQYSPHSGAAVDGPNLNESYNPGLTYCPFNCGVIAGRNSYYGVTDGGTYEQQARETYGPGYNFSYTQPLVATAKSASPASGSNVKPGDTVSYRVSASNTGSDTHDYQLLDYIPENIDPSSVSNVSATVNGVPTLASVSISGGGPSISVTAGYFPNGASVVLTWNGRVRPANQVGVFPADYRYCANPSSWSTRGDVTTHSDDYYDPAGARRGSSCEDYSSGLQAVANFARSSYHTNFGFSSGFSGWGRNTDNSVDTRGGAASDVVINPIPGNITCFDKITPDAQADPTASPQTSPCGTAYQSRYIYSNQEYNTATFRMHVAPDASLGPVEYAVQDQNSGAMDPAVPSNASDIAFNPAQSASGVNTGLTFANRTADWHNFVSTVTGAADYTLQFKFVPQGVGHAFTNTSNVCWPQYWVSGHPQQCINSNPLSFLEVGIDYPYLTSDKGDVHAGGGVVDNYGLCPNQLRNTNQNPPRNGTPQGQYFVTASGDAGSYFDSVAGAKNTHYGIVCRPDLVASAANYIARNGRQTVSGPITSDSGYSGQIVEVTAPNGYTLNNGALNMTKRWTLFVHGNLYINGDVTDSDSFGVIVDGNIFINHNVKNLSGFYYATGKINTCADGPTGVPTLNYGLDVPTCGNRLVVNGMLMANAFRFNRTYHASDNQASEQVDFSRLLYTSTPPAFSDLGKLYLPPTYLGEQAPRY